MSNYAPLPGELHCIRHYIRTGEEELSRLEADLGALEATMRISELNVAQLLAQLQSAQAILQLNRTTFDAKLAQRAVVADDLAQKRATLRPIRLLPNEVLACIFEFCVQSQEHERREKLCSLTDEATGGDRQRLSVLSIAGVCKRWKDIIVSLKQLWRFVHIGAHLLDDEEGNWEAARYFAANAKGTPLDVFINDFPTQEEDISRFRTCISKLTTTRTLWKESRRPLNSLAVGAENVFDFTEPFSNVRTNKFVFRIYSGEKGEDPDQQGPNIFCTDFFYSVQDARLFYIPSLLYPIPMHIPNLKHLEILIGNYTRRGGSTAAHYWIWPLLESAKCLESLILRVHSSIVGIGIEPFSHSTLQSLNIQVEDLEGLEPLLDWVSLPSLRHLTICTHNIGEAGLRGPFNSFLRHLLGAGAQVQHLQVEGSPIYRRAQKFGWVIDNLPFLPHIRRLEMHEPGDVTLMLEALSEPIPHASFGSPLPSSYLIPALESVVLDGVTFEEGVLRKFINCRRPEGKATDAGSVQSLKAVTVNEVEVLRQVLREAEEDMMY